MTTILTPPPVPCLPGCVEPHGPAASTEPRICAVQAGETKTLDRGPAYAVAAQYVEYGDGPATLAHEFAVDGAVVGREVHLVLADPQVPDMAIMTSAQAREVAAALLRAADLADFGRTTAARRPVCTTPPTLATTAGGVR